MSFSDPTHHLLYVDTKNKLYLFLNSAIRTFAYSLVSIFLPAFIIHEMGQPLWVVFGFFGAYYGIGTLLCIPIAKVTSLYGSKIGMLIGSLFLIPYLYCMGLLVEDTSWLWIGVIFGGIFEGIFWIPFHHDMSQICNSKKSGQSIAWLNIIMIIATALAPLVGGIYIDTFSAKSLLFVAAGLTALSIIPLLLSPKSHHPKKYSFKISINRIQKNSISKDIFIAYVGASLVWLVGSTTWPLIMYLKLENYTLLGTITSFTTIAIIVLIHYAGKRINKTRGIKILPKIVKTDQATWAGIALTTFLGFMSLPLIIILDTVRRACSAVSWTTLDHTLYHEANKHKTNPIYPIFTRQIAINATVTLYCGLFAWIFYYHTDMRLLAVSIIPMLVTIGFQRDIFDHEKHQNLNIGDEVQEIQNIN